MNLSFDDCSRGVARETRLILNRVTRSRVVQEADRLIRVMEGEGEDDIQVVVELIVAKAIHESLRTDVYSELIRRVLKSSDAVTNRHFKRYLHERCEVCFNRFLPDSDEACGTTRCVCTFITQLYLHRVVSAKIVQSCVIHCLFGATASRAYIPSALCITVVHSMLSLCAQYLREDAPANLKLYVSRLDDLRPHYPASTRLLIDNLLQLHSEGWPDTRQQTPLLSHPSPSQNKKRMVKETRETEAPVCI